MTGVSLSFAAALAGLVFGLMHFAALRRTVELYSGGRSRLAAAALTIGRIAGAILFFGLAARLGSLPLLSSFLGLLLARTLALRAAQRTA
jgi:N-ATPase, AtpR subunit